MAHGRVYQRRAGGNWYLDYTYNGRRMRQRIGPNKRVAESALHKRLTQAAENAHLDVSRVREVRFEDFAATYLENHAKPNKRSWATADAKYLKKLVPYFGRKFLSEITPIMIERYKALRRTEVSVASVNREVALLKCMFNRAIAWDMAVQNPVRKVRLFKENNTRTRYLEKEEINRLLQNSSPVLRAVIVVAVNTGMRKGEIMKLRWSDMDFHRGYATLRETKSGERRIVPLNRDAKDAILSVRKHAESPYVFAGREGKPVNFRKAFGTAVRKSGIVDFRFHDLRHTFASHLVMAGVDLNTVRELLGHKTISMTLRYSHLSPDHKARAVEALRNRLRTGSAQKIGTVWAQNTVATETGQVGESASPSAKASYKASLA